MDTATKIGIIGLAAVITMKVAVCYGVWQLVVWACAA